MCQTLSGDAGCTAAEKTDSGPLLRVYIQVGEHKITGEDGIKKGKCMDYRMMGEKQHILSHWKPHFDDVLFEQRSES